MMGVIVLDKSSSLHISIIFAGYDIAVVHRVSNASLSGAIVDDILEVRGIRLIYDVAGSIIYSMACVVHDIKDLAILELSE